MASNTGYVLGGAVAGAIVKVILQGEYSWQAFWSAVASVILGASITVVLAHFYPSFSEDVVFVSGLASIITSVSGGLFVRLQKAQIKASVAGVEVNSNGEDK